MTTKTQKASFNGVCGEYLTKQKKIENSTYWPLTLLRWAKVCKIEFEILGILQIMEVFLEDVSVYGLMSFRNHLESVSSE